VWIYINVTELFIYMVHEKRQIVEKKPTKEHLPLNETMKCKSHIFKQAYDQVRKQKLGG